MITLPFVADYSATDFSKRASQVLDMAGHGAVRVRRMNEVFVVLRERQLNDIVEDARDPRPKSLEDMLEFYDADDIKANLKGWLEDKPAVNEAL